MDASEWSAVIAGVDEQMRVRIARYTTPLALSIDPEGKWGESLGSGSYVCVENDLYVITNAHVAAATVGGSITHRPRLNDYFERCGDFGAIGAPEDVAAARVLSTVRSADDRIEMSMFDDRYSPVDDELLFWAGFPGTTGDRDRPGSIRRVAFENLPVHALSMTCQEWAAFDASQVSDFRQDYHVALHYPNLAQRSETGESVVPPAPEGLSGSLLWDTKVIRCLRDQRQWSAAEAQVCGLIWGHTQHPAAIYATRIEHVRAALECIHRRL